MDIKKLADVKDRFADYEKIFNSGDYDKAADILSAILERIEECTDERKAGTMDDTFVKKSDMDGRPIYISLNHVMEYYVYACYFEPRNGFAVYRAAGWRVLQDLWQSVPEVIEVSQS